MHCVLYGPCNCDHDVGKMGLINLKPYCTHCAWWKRQPGIAELFHQSSSVITHSRSLDWQRKIPRWSALENACVSTLCLSFFSYSNRRQMAHYGSLTKTRPGRQWWSKWPSEQRNRGEKLKEKITKRHICVLREDGGKNLQEKRSWTWETYGRWQDIEC